MLEQKEIWIDEKGVKVNIFPFFSKVYIDKESEILSSKYKLWENCDGETRLSTLGSNERESLAAQILLLVRSTHLNPPRLVGIKKTELETVGKNSCSIHWSINNFIKEDLLREKWIKGNLVLFPTEKLLENQKIPKRE